MTRDHRRRRAVAAGLAAIIIASCTGDDDTTSAPTSAASDEAVPTDDRSATSTSERTRRTTTTTTRRQRPERPTTSTRDVPPRQAIVDEVCEVLRAESFVDARAALGRGQRRFSDAGGDGFVHTRVARACPNGFARYERVATVAGDVERAITELTTGPGFLDAIGCTQAGMELRITNRIDRPVGMLLLGRFGKLGKRKLGSPAIVVWRLGAGRSELVPLPAVGPAAGRQGSCSAVAIPWIPREEPAATAAWPIDDDGRPVEASGKLKRSVRDAYRLGDEFACYGDRRLLQGFVDVRVSSFDRRLSSSRCVIGRQGRVRERDPVYLCPTRVRSDNYAVVEVKVPKTRIEIAGKRRKVVPRHIEMGVMRRSPADNRWRWVVEPQTVRTGRDLGCARPPVLTVGSNT